MTRGGSSYVEGGFGVSKETRRVEMSEPWQRDPTGLFYTPPGTDYRDACFFGCGLLIGAGVIIYVLATTLGTTAAIAAAVIMVLIFWFWDR